MPAFRKSNGFTNLINGEYNRTLARKLVPVADSLRDLLTKAGLRPYVLRLVWTEWTRGMRDEGTEEVVRMVQILPTPKVQAVETLEEVVRAVGTEEFGEILVTQISARYTENFLRGFGEDGSETPANQSFYYEIEFPNENGTFPGIKRRFTLQGAPALYPGRFGWELKLRKAIANRGLDGIPQGDV